MSTSKREDKAQERAIDKTIDETKDKTNSVLQEAKRELPEFTAIFHDYQEQNINTIREMTTTFLESQKEVAKSLNAAASSGRSPNSALSINIFMWPYSYWTNPREAIEAYSKAANTFADTTIAATRLSNDMMAVSLEATSSLMKRELKDTKAISKFMVDSAKDIEHMR
jgi:hypothetical protein